MKKGAVAERPDEMATEGPLSAAPHSLRQRKKDATHQAIADAAWELFAEHGYEQTSINDIADRANVAPRTFFRYFPTKEAVVYPELDRMLDSVREQFFRRPSDEPLMTSLIETLSTMAESMTDDSDRNRQRLAILKRSPSDSISEHVRRRLTDQVEDWVRIREQDGPDAELRAKLASGIIGLIMDTSREHWVATGAMEALPDVGQRCMSLVFELLTPRAT